MKKTLMIMMIISTCVLSADDTVINERNVRTAVDILEKIFTKTRSTNTNNTNTQSERRPVSTRNIYLTREQLAQMMEIYKQKGREEGYRKGYRDGYTDALNKKEFDINKNPTVENKK